MKRTALGNLGDQRCIGAAVAREFKQAGYTVAITYHGKR